MDYRDNCTVLLNCATFMQVFQEKWLHYLSCDCGCDDCCKSRDIPFSLSKHGDSGLVCLLCGEATLHGNRQLCGGHVRSLARAETQPRFKAAAGMGVNSDSASHSTILVLVWTVTRYTYKQPLRFHVAFIDCPYDWGDYDWLSLRACVEYYTGT